MSPFNASTTTQSNDMTVDTTQLVNVSNDTRIFTLESHKPNETTSQPTHHPYHSTMKHITVHHSSHHHTNHSNASNARSQLQNPRPLATYTSLGSPIHHRVVTGRTRSGRARSMSLGDGIGESMGSYSFHGSPSGTYTPAFHEIGDAQALGKGGIWMLPNNLSASPGVFLSPTLPTHCPPSHCPPSVKTMVEVGTSGSHFDLSESQRKAFDSALATEHMRAKACEQEEVLLTTEELREILRRERTRSAKQNADLAVLRCGTVPQQQIKPNEVLEEGRMIRLVQRMEMLQEERGRIVIEIEREEELLSNSLQRRLEIQREKCNLEAQIAFDTNECASLRHELSTLCKCNNRRREASLDEEDEMEEES